jgi:hypothetical protein
VPPAVRARSPMRESSSVRTHWRSRRPFHSPSSQPRPTSALVPMTQPCCRLSSPHHLPTLVLADSSLSSLRSFRRRHPAFRAAVPQPSVERRLLSYSRRRSRTHITVDTHFTNDSNNRTSCRGSTHPLQDACAAGCFVSATGLS